MTFEEALKVFGWDEPPWEFTRESQEGIIATAMELTDNGTKPIDPQMRNLCRAQIEMFD